MGMKTRYKYIYFLQIEQKPKTSVWHCRSRGSDNLLGAIKWHGNWRQYCFFPGSDTIFNGGCLEDINDFIRQLGKDIK